MIFNLLIAPLIALVFVIAWEIVKLPFKFTIFLIKSPFVLAERLLPSTEALLEGVLEIIKALFVVALEIIKALFVVANHIFNGLHFLITRYIDLFPKNSTRQAEFETLNCVYMGTDRSSGKKYIGQTTMFPEQRFLQHRKAMTGPFKGNAKNVKWEILKENISDTDLDYWESYYIGYYDTFKNGYNSTRGNNYLAYKKGSK